MEHRSFKGTVEVRTGLNGQPVITGYAAVFNRDSSDMGFVEQVDPDAFTKTIREADVRGLGNHDINWLLGRVKSGTCRLTVDDVGLRYEIDVNENDPDGVRAIEKVRRGDWDGSSFSFNTIRDEWNWQTTPPQRRLLEVALIDVGPVTFPAYPDSTAAARALEPIAKKTGHPVDTLVTAMRTGEIRSLVDSTAAAEQRAQWDTAYVNDLPDSAFLYIEPGGKKDDEGKTTPRTLRHFPYKDASGNVDLPHLRNALARIPQSNLPDDVKAAVTAKAEKILAAQEGKNSLDRFADEVEQRVGKTLSAASMAKIRAAMEQLRELIAGAEADNDKDDGTLLGQALESDSLPLAKEMDSATPDREISSFQARATLAALEQRVLEDAAA